MGFVYEYDSDGDKVCGEQVEWTQLPDSGEFGEDIGILWIEEPVWALSEGNGRHEFWLERL